MRERLLDFICCPECFSDFRLVDPVHDPEFNEIRSGSLVCSACGLKFPVVDFIPRIIRDHLSIERIANARAFGYEWKNFSTLKEKYESQFLDWIAPVKADFFKGKIVLDVGCGKGRHSFLASKFGAGEVVGVDISEAVEVAWHNTRLLGNVHIVQTDIYHLPLKKCFDYVYSVGVLHHLPDPARGMEFIHRFLKNGGALSVWVYGRENNGWIVNIIDPVRKMVTSRMPFWLMNSLSWVLGMILYLAIRGIYRPVNRLSPALGRLLFYNDYLYYISKFNLDEVSSIVFDHLAAPVSHYITGDQFRQWFSASGLEKVNIRWHNSNSWAGWAEKMTRKYEKNR